MNNSYAGDLREPSYVSGLDSLTIESGDCILTITVHKGSMSGVDSDGVKYSHTDCLTTLLEALEGRVNLKLKV